MTWIARVGINHLQDDGHEARYEAGDVVPDSIATANEWLAAQGWIERVATPDASTPAVINDPEPPVAAPDAVVADDAPAEEVTSG